MSKLAYKNVACDKNLDQKHWELDAANTFREVGRSRQKRYRNRIEQDQRSKECKWHANQ